MHCAIQQKCVSLFTVFKTLTIVRFSWNKTFTCDSSQCCIANFPALTILSPNEECEGFGGAHPCSRHPHIVLPFLPVEHVQSGLVSTHSRPRQTGNVSVNKQTHVSQVVMPTNSCLCLKFHITTYQTTTQVMGYMGSGDFRTQYRSWDLFRPEVSNHQHIMGSMGAWGFRTVRTQDTYVMGSTGAWGFRTTSVSCSCRFCWLSGCCCRRPLVSAFHTTNTPVWSNADEYFLSFWWQKST